MPSQTQYDLATLSLKSLVLYLAFAAVVSKASPIPQSISTRGMGISSPSEDRMSLKNVLEWLFAGVAVIILSLVFISRALFLRARNRPLRDFFTFIEAPRQARGSSQGPMRPSPDVSTSMPSNRQGRERARATDIDSGGRRGGGPDPDDTNGDFTEKDILPAYEVKGGPPNYNRFLAVDLGTSTNARLQITETVPVGRSPQSQLLEASSGTTNPSVQTSSTLDVRLPHPPPPSYSPATTANQLDIYHVPSNH